MSVDQQKRDRVITVVFTQMEMLQELAASVGDAELADDLSIAFAKALARYCDDKRAQLETRVAGRPHVGDVGPPGDTRNRTAA